MKDVICSVGETSACNCCRTYECFLPQFFITDWPIACYSVLMFLYRSAGSGL